VTTADAPRWRALVAKTSLDGHWRGVGLVARALADNGFEVVYLGMATPEEIARAAVHEDVDIVGLNMGGRIDGVLNSVAALREAGSDAPVMVGGTIPPQARPQLHEMGIATFPPGSMLSDIVASARDLAERREAASR
jgi:methylmalonyl-CoA mutase C-terminal domain/subunit